MTRPHTISLRLALWLSCAALLGGLAGCRPKAPPPPPTVQLQLTSSPAGAQVLVDDKLVGTTPFDAPVRKAPHVVQLQLTGYDTEWRMITTTMLTKPVAFDIVLSPTTAAVYITTTPPGAFVMLDGTDRGPSPVVVAQVGLGEHQVVLHMAGCADKQVAFSVNGPRPVRVDERMDSVMGQLRVFSSPTGADIYINDQSYGTTPEDSTVPLIVKDLSAGEYQVRAERPGYQSITQAVLVKRNATQEVRLPTMKQLPGSVEITSDPPGAKVYNNTSELLGVTPLSLTDLPDGEASYRIEKEGFAPASQSVTIARGLVKHIDVTLTSSTGSVTLSTEPPGVMVYLDGKLVGTTQPADNPQVSRILSVDGVTPGPHRIDLALATFEPARQSVFVEQGKTSQMKLIKLRKQWLPTHELKVVYGQVYRGVLLSRKPDGSVDFERAPNIIVTYKANEIEYLKPLTKEAGP